jgi:hypothetical protein
VKRPALLLAASTLVMGCGFIVGDYQEAPAEGVSSAPLCEIERATFTFEIDRESNEQLADVESYYELRNPELDAHLGDLAQAYGNGDPGAGVTYVMGAAGVGKSFSLRNVLTGFDDADKCSIELSDLFGDDSNLLDFAVVDAPDLATLDGAVVFNELPSMEAPSSFELTSLFTAAGCDVAGTLEPLIVIDDLDEIHGDAATRILEAVDQYILDGAAGAGPFIHFIVAGTPEAFNSWLTDPDRTEENNAILDTFLLSPPRYETAGDLDLRIRGYLDFTMQLAGLEASGELDGYIQSVTDGVGGFPFLTYTMGNLAVGNAVIELTRPGVDKTEPSLKAGLFDTMLQRAAQSKGRPEAADELGGAYLRLLEEIAVRYIDVSDAGVFSVLSEDKLELVDDSGDMLGEVRVRDVLNRSDLVLLTSATTSDGRYRFDPFWLHAHLVERRNQRTIPGYAYRTCEP